MPPINDEERLWMGIARAAFPGRGWGLAVDEDCRAVVAAIKAKGYRVVKLRPATEGKDAYYIQAANVWVIEEEL